MESADGTPDAYSVDLVADADVLAKRLTVLYDHNDVKLALLLSGAIPIGPPSSSKVLSVPQRKEARA